MNDGLYLQMEWNDVAINHYLLYKLTDDHNIQHPGRYGSYNIVERYPMSNTGGTYLLLCCPPTSPGILQLTDELFRLTGDNSRGGSNPLSRKYG